VETEGESQRQPKAVDRGRKARWDQLALALAGAAAFVMGATVHADRASLAVALVGIGAGLLLLAALLPRLQQISAKVAGSEFSLSLLPQARAVSDQILVQRPAGGPVGTSQQDLRGTATFASGLAGFGEAIKGGPASYAIVNLEEGKAWLTSRLLIFVQSLVELRGITAVVFTNRSEGIDKFVGVASVCDIVSRFHWAFPWLSEALGRSWENQRWLGNGPARRRLHADGAEPLYDAYVNAIRVHGPLPAQGRAEEWEQLEDGVWEHAMWLDSAIVKELLGRELSEEFIVESVDRATSSSQAVAFGEGRWIAIVDNELRLLTVLDRWVLIDRMRKA
jgi:hypothetical protein